MSREAIADLARAGIDGIVLADGEQVRYTYHLTQCSNATTSQLRALLAAERAKHGDETFIALSDDDDEDDDGEWAPAYGSEEHIADLCLPATPASHRVRKPIDRPAERTATPACSPAGPGTTVAARPQAHRTTSLHTPHRPARCSATSCHHGTTASGEWAGAGKSGNRGAASHPGL